MTPAEFWSVGDYRIVGDLWGVVGRDVASSLDASGRDIVDLATGTGVTAIALALLGARSVVGVDITPSLLSEAARRAGEAGITARWIEADVTTLPLPTASADLVTSTFGLVFAADPAAALGEARRITRPGGSIVFTSWSPNGLFGDIRRIMAGYFPEAPAPWHESEEGIRTVAGVEAVVDERSFELAVESPETLIELFERHSPPILLAAQTLGERWPPARTDLLEAITRCGNRRDGKHRIEVSYLVTTLTVR